MTQKMTFDVPCEVAVLCLSPGDQIFFFFCPPVETRLFIYIKAKSKVTSEFVFHHVGISINFLKILTYNKMFKYYSNIQRTTDMLTI